MRPANWWGGHILEWGGKKRGKRERRMTGGRKLEVAHRGEDKPAWPEFSTCPRAAVALPLQHAALQCARVCVLCASNRVSCVDSHVYIWSWCCKCELCLCRMFFILAICGPHTHQTGNPPSPHTPPLRSDIKQNHYKQSVLSLTSLRCLLKASPVSALSTLNCKTALSRSQLQ